VNLHGLHQRVLLVTLHGSPRRVRTRLPARYPLLAITATHMTLDPLLRHCLDHPAPLRQYESHVSDQPPTRSTGPGCLRGTCPSWALQPTRPWLLSSRPTPCMYQEGQCSRYWVARPTSSLHGILVDARLRPAPLHGVLVQVVCAAPAHPEPFSLHDLGYSPPVQLPTCTRRDNARDVGSLIQPVLCTV